MDSLIQGLSGLLLKAVPTVILLLLVHVYLKYVFFRPLQDVLKKRREATEGTRAAAEESIARANEKAAMYEIALKEARGEMYREQEETRRRWLDHQASRIEEARHRTHAAIQDANQALTSDVDVAKREVASTSQVLALQIVESLAAGRMK